MYFYMYVDQLMEGVTDSFSVLLRLKPANVLHLPGSSTEANTYDNNIHNNHNNVNINNKRNRTISMCSAKSNTDSNNAFYTDENYISSDESVNNIINNVNINANTSNNDDDFYDINIGIFGLCTDQTVTLSTPGDTVKFNNVVDTAKV